MTGCTELFIQKKVAGHWASSVRRLLSLEAGLSAVSAVSFFSPSQPEISLLDAPTLQFNLVSAAQNVASAAVRRVFTLTFDLGVNEVLQAPNKVGCKM